MSDKKSQEGKSIAKPNVSFRSEPELMTALEKETNKMDDEYQIDDDVYNIHLEHLDSLTDALRLFNLKLRER